MSSSLALIFDRLSALSLNIACESISPAESRSSENY